MNVLILTPDAVGSTLLQRLITVYMQFHKFDKPVINIHELALGIDKFFSHDFNREILCRAKTNGFYQTMPEIIDLLKNADHYKVCRLAKYHLNARNDGIENELPFYEYLDENFFVIATRRHNLFEHALSWGINKITKKLNVYSPTEKIDTFMNLYKSSVTLDKQAFYMSLENYKDYVNWSEKNFNIGSYFYYDQHVDNIEKYILNLPIFAGQPAQITWQDVFNIDFANWNRCHFFTSNMETLALENKTEPVAQLTFDKKHDEKDLEFLDRYYDYTKDSHHDRNLALTECSNLKTMVSYLPQEQISFLKENFSKYADAADAVRKMHYLGILPTTIPIKKQTLAAKRFMVKNFDQCLDVYNQWIARNPSFGKPINAEDLEENMAKEQNFWSHNPDTKLLS
jgi:hypothetical protein